MQELLDEFKTTIADGYKHLAGISETESGLQPAPGKWSPKVIIGHLIDSASNNHQRFVRVQLYDDLDLPGYEQERWVAVQGYQGASWSALLLLWKSFNEHLLHIVSLIPERRLSSRCRIGGGEPVTLSFLVEDYLRHMQKHLRQISG